MAKRESSIESSRITQDLNNLVIELKTLMAEFKLRQDVVESKDIAITAQEDSDNPVHIVS